MSPANPSRPGRQRRKRKHEKARIRGKAAPRAGRPDVSLTPELRRFGENLEGAIVAKGITQADVSRSLDEGPSAINAWVRGKAYPRIPTLLRLVELLDVDIADLLTKPPARKEAA